MVSFLIFDNRTLLTKFIIELQVELYRYALYGNMYYNKHKNKHHTIKVNDGKNAITVYIDKINVIRFKRIENKFKCVDISINYDDIVKTQVLKNSILTALENVNND